MGGLNPSIPLSIQQPRAAENPLDQYARVLAIKNEATQSQLQQQAQQSNAIALKTQQQQYEDQQTLRELAPKFSGKDKDGNGTYDLDGLASAAESRGVSPALTNQIRQQHYTQVEAAAKAGTAQLDLEQKHNQKRYQIIEGVKAIDDPGERETAYQQGLNSLATDGADVSHLPKNAPDNKALEAYESQLGMHNQILTDAASLAKTNEANATAAAKKWEKFPELGVMVNTETGEQRQVNGAQGAMTPGMMQSKYVNIQEKKKLGQPLSAEEQAYGPAYEKLEAIKPSIQNYFQQGGPLAPGNAPTPGGAPPAQAAPLTPEQTAAKAQTAPGGWVGPKGETLNNVPATIRGEVKQVLEYRRADPNITARGAVAQPINAWVATLDDKHDATTYGNRNKTLTDFEKDASTGELGAVNTALGHLGELHTAAQALQGGDLPILHSIAGKLGLATGDDAASTYQSILHRVGPEMTKAYLKSGGTEGERGANEADFDIGKGQKQILSNIAESAQLLNSKLASKKQAWETGFKPYREQDSFENRFLTPDAKKTLANLSAQAPTNRAAAGGGAAHVIAIGGKNYKYNGSGPTNDLKSYTAVP